MTLQNLIKQIQNTSQLDLMLQDSAIPRETRPEYNYDETGRPIIPELRKNMPNPLGKVAADALIGGKDFYNSFTGGYGGELLIGGADKALENIAYGMPLDKDDATDLSLLTLGPLAKGITTLPKVVNKINESISFIPKNLPLDEATNLARRRTADNVVPFINQYKNRPDTLGGRKIDTDAVRELFPEYNNPDTLVNEIFDTTGSRYRSADIHEGASDLSKIMYDDLLEAPIPSGITDKVTFTAGSAGAGKSRGIASLPKNIQPDLNSKVFYDTNLANFDSARKKIDKALKSGDGNTPVDIFYVHKPIEGAFKNTLQRTKNQTKKFGSGRVVNIDGMLDTNLGALKTIKKLENTYKNNPLVNIKVIDNTSNTPKLMNIKNLPKTPSKKDAENKLFKILAKEKLDPEHLNMLLREKINPFVKTKDTGSTTYGGFLGLIDSY